MVHITQIYRDCIIYGEYPEGETVSRLTTVARRSPTVTERQFYHVDIDTAHDDYTYYRLYPPTPKEVGQ